MKPLSRQQRILVKYLQEAGGSMTTYEIGRRFLNEYNAIWFDVRRRASELAKLGILTSDRKTPARYTLIKRTSNPPVPAWNESTGWETI